MKRLSCFTFRNPQTYFNKEDATKSLSLNNNYFVQLLPAFLTVAYA